MGKIIYKPGSLFASKAGILLQANNAIGKCGKGIALEFLKRYPDACRQYTRICENSRTVNRRSELIGMPLIIEDAPTGRTIVFLVTSQGYGKYVDKPSLILEATEKSVSSLLASLAAKAQGGAEVSSNMFNSGLFRVPWADTEKVIEDLLAKYPLITWTVWTG
jgi:ADP-ribose 1''-phosphate phosphatase